MSTDRPHIIVLHRWRDTHAHYADYIDHAAAHVTYVSTELGRASLPPTAAAVTTVALTDDLPAVRAAVTGLVARFGAPARLIALNEGDLDTAALIREEFAIPGQHTAELAVFRDKLTMCRTAEAAGLPVPAFAPAPDPAAVLAFGEAHGWPLVVKPHRGTASRGVVQIDSAAELAALSGPAGDLAAALAAEPHLVQSYVDGPILHIDGLWEGDSLGSWTVSRYVGGTCADFTQGTWLGSVEEDDPALLEAVEAFAAAVGPALGGSQPWVFHLEAFVTPAPGGGPALVFLECGARVGGGEIPFTWRDVHGVDLMAAAVDIQLGLTPVLPPLKTGEVGGYLLLPLPVPAPCRVEAAGWVREPAPGRLPYAVKHTPVGSTAPAISGYEHVGTRFRFRGATTRDVEAAITESANSFRLTCVPVGAPSADGG
ncbi:MULTISPECIES: acetyl-CoA carboxylase biotin carboxylase subunit family protein [unclassified Streptomyces]|uniref:ATP-grasp domain-containing protein n=1 Tax=unclassified Streptomyces TaxID=2593676 RepID=UPI00202DEB74|nr:MULTISPECIES: biotin carboxylase [unclassified Streptomyces]MCM1966250.1 biotin carboxylase [Streptomyces sp. G1]MCX5125861.1 biotin carboxylase [Streptomyces sp. NBC_00347]